MSARDQIISEPDEPGVACLECGALHCDPATALCDACEARLDAEQAEAEAMDATTFHDPEEWRR